MPDVTAIYGTPFDSITIFWVFSHIFDANSCPNCFISTKLSPIVYLIDIDMSKCQMSLQVMECLLIRFVFANFAQN